MVAIVAMVSMVETVAGVTNVIEYHYINCFTFFK